MTSRKYSFLVIICFFILVISCNKTSFLDTKPNSGIVVPNTLDDLRALMDGFAFGPCPYLGEQSSDNYYLNYSDWQALYLVDKNSYVWEPDLYDGLGHISDWNMPYQQVFYSNVVLDGLKNIQITPTNKDQWNFIAGSAMYFRAFAFYNLASEFAPAFDSSSSKSDFGVILKLTSDVNANPGRASVYDTYQQIISDLKAAATLLPTTVPTSTPNRTSRPAAFGLLGRCYLSMRIYDKALAYADSALQLYPYLVDYNILPAMPTNPPFAYVSDINTAEKIIQSTLVVTSGIFYGGAYGTGIIDSTLYNSFSDDDLRKSIYFMPYSGNIFIGWNYSGSYVPFSGIATDELYLIRAECFARQGNVTNALQDLNLLLSKRYKSGTYTSLATLSVSDALNTILVERRKELVFRGIRWTDIRRLNKEGANIILTRNFNGSIYKLSPNSPLYVLPIPDDEISISKVPQNIRF